MKYLVLIILLGTYCLVTVAQPPSGSEERKLQTDLRRLDSRFERMKNLGPTDVNSRNEMRVKRAIESAATELNNFRQKHPDYDVKKYENELTEFRKNQEKALATKEIEVDKIGKFVASVEEIIDFRPPVSRFISGEVGVLVETKTALTDFQKKMDSVLTADFLELAENVENRQIKNIRAKAAREAVRELGRLNEIRTENVKETSNENLMLARYFDILYSRERFILLKKIFGNDPEIQKTLEKSNILISELGTLEEIRELAGKNYAARIARIRMYPEADTNLALKKEFITAFRSYYARPKILTADNIIKFRIISRVWSIERNKLTGIILNRSKQGQFVLKAVDGRCFLYTFIMQQNYHGSSYGKGVGVGNQETEILCSNVPK